MLNRYRQSGATPFIGKVMLVMKTMKAELYEHRYYFERNVERRTEHLLKRIALLESCNAALCDRLAVAQKELAALKHQPAHPLPKQDAEPNERTAKLYVMDNPTEKSIGSNLTDNWGDQPRRLMQSVSLY